MENDIYIDECKRQLLDYFVLLKNNHKNIEQMNRIQGFLKAGEFLNLITRSNANELMESMYMQVFGETIDKNRKKKENRKLALKGENEEYFNIPAVSRNKL